MFAFSTLAVAVSLAAAVAADHGHGLHARSHHHVGRSSLQKRYSGTATYYAVGMGACGQNNVPSDFIVALNSAQYGDGYPGPNCFKPITICANGKCVGATIMDKCPTCAYGSLDLSEGLFKQFASTDAGVFQMTWTFDGEGGGDTKPTSTKKPDPTTTWKPEPTTTWKPEPEPTTTWEEPTTTSTKKKTTTSSPPPETTSTEQTTSSTSSTPTTTSTVESTSSSSTSSAVSTNAAGTGTSAAPSASASSTPATGSGNGSGSGSGSNLNDANQVMLAFGRLVTAAKST